MGTIIAIAFIGVFLYLCCAIVAHGYLGYSSFHGHSEREPSCGHDEDARSRRHGAEFLLVLFP